MAEKETKGVHEGTEFCHGHDHDKLFFWIVLSVALLGLIVVAIIGVATTCDRNEHQYQNVLTVSGTHELDVSPDEAVLVVQVMTRGEKAAAVSAENKELTMKVTTALQSLSSVQSELETTGVTLQRWTEWNGKDQSYSDKGYEQITTLKITTDSIDRVGTLLDAAVAAGANSVVDVTFQLKPETEERYTSQALMAATQAAKAKAQLLADAAGAKLGDLTSLNENSYVRPYYYNTKSEMAFSDAADAAPTPVLPQKVTIQASVGMSYELKDGHEYKK